MVMKASCTGIFLSVVGITAVNPVVAAAQTDAASPPVLTAQPIQWQKAPGKAELSYYEPDRAQRMAQSGNSAMTCQLVAAGSLTECAISAESPTGFGFGAATLRLARFFKAAPDTQNRSVSVSVHWDYRGGSTISTETVSSSQ